MSVNPLDLVRVARAEVGYHEGRSAGHWNNDQKYAGQVPGLGWANGQPWCAVFVAWCARRAGAGDLFPVTASCDVAAAWFRERDQWSEYPAVGAQVFYGTPDDLTHTGLVVGYDETYVFVVEGNTNDRGGREGDGVYLKTRRRHDPWVVGYGYPALALDSADPSYAPPPAVPEPATRGAKVEHAAGDLVDARDHARPGSVRRRALRAAVRAVRAVPGLRRRRHRPRPA